MREVPNIMIILRQTNTDQTLRPLQPGAYVDIAVRSDTVCQLAWSAFQLQRKIRWDPVVTQFDVCTAGWYNWRMESWPRPETPDTGDLPKGTYTDE